MRLLIGMPDPGSWGGPNACEPPFVAALAALGVEIQTKTYSYGDKAVATGLATRVLRVLRTAAGLRRLARQSAFDLIHLNSSFDVKALLRDFVCLARLRSTNTPVFLKLHGSDPELLAARNPCVRWLAQAVVQRATAIGVLSQAERTAFIRHGVPTEKLFVVPNVVVANPADRGEPVARTSGNAIALLFVARFIATKGLEDTIRACALLAQRGHDFSLTCVGDGPERRRAETLVAAHGLTGQIKFSGYVAEAEVASYMGQSDVLLFPTFHIEGFPMVIFNAMAFGLALVTTRIRAAADYLVQPEHCLWVEAHSPEQIAEQVARLIAHPELRLTMARNNAQLVKRFAPGPVAELYLGIYEQVCRRRHGD